MNRGIWPLKLARKRHKCDYGLCGAIITYFGVPFSLADLGCGSGLYCKFFKSVGSSIVHGFEGTQDVTSLGVYSTIFTVDLTVDLQNRDLYNMVLCLEVGEHIPLVYEQVFLDNVRSFVGKSLVMSWARPGQYSASGHVNCRPMEYIEEEIVRRGLVFNNPATDFLKGVSDFPWLRDNLMVFGVKNAG